MKGWEYHVERVIDDTLPAKILPMNELGALGWELVAQVHVGNFIILTYKRPRGN
jgi:hypothetical protein